MRDNYQPFMPMTDLQLRNSGELVFKALTDFIKTVRCECDVGGNAIEIKLDAAVFDPLAEYMRKEAQPQHGTIGEGSTHTIRWFNTVITRERSAKK